MRFRLIPRDESFYPMFDRQAKIAADTAVVLQSLITSLPISAEQVSTVVAAEKEADGVLRDIRKNLEQSIVTPFDREDIQSLSNALDDVLDQMRAAADSAFQHNIGTPLPGIEQLLALLVDITDKQVTLVRGLRTLRDLTPTIDEIERIESEADGQYRRVMAELFSGRHDALDILRWKDVVEAIEAAIDAVEDASDEVQSIAVKHA
jgi:predicted phosphate transport protein (TIGR00153 family)